LTGSHRPQSRPSRTWQWRCIGSPCRPGAGPPTFAFRGPVDPTVPSWSRRPALWRQAIDLRAAGEPPTPHGLLHSDFHFGNILWQNDTVNRFVTRENQPEAYRSTHIDGQGEGTAWPWSTCAFGRVWPSSRRSSLTGSSTSHLAGLRTDRGGLHSRPGRNPPLAHSAAEQGDRVVPALPQPSTHESPAARNATAETRPGTEGWAARWPTI